ncbi:hypothetical protein [uncultured Microbacterium sp.]|uniref:hypothetical protein n=1 Tax=uncultured Microbacterium sp. TaxID=191216 RepID=UPI002609CFBF|nr:hypothetical protein [uncultured Microbacterium sp.]
MSDPAPSTGSDPTEPSPPDSDEMPTTEELQEPSTEKEAEEVPTAPERTEPEPSHEAVGIGIIGRPQVEPETIQRED